MASQKAVAFLQSDISGCKASPVVFTYLITFRNTRCKQCQINQWTSQQQRTWGHHHILTSEACSQASASQPGSAETTGNSHAVLVLVKTEPILF